MSSVPLTDVLPWGDSIPTGGRTILICDSTETNGRFILYTMASQCLNSSPSLPSSLFASNATTATSTSKKMNDATKGKVLWIHCGSSTDNDIRAALKKAGCDSSSIAPSASPSGTGTFSSSRNLNQEDQRISNNYSQLETINVNKLLSEHFCTTIMNIEKHHDLQHDNRASDEQDTMAFHKSLIKDIYQQAKRWIIDIDVKTDDSYSTSFCNPLIILDNATLLSTQFGPQLTHALIQKLQHLLLTNKNNNNNHNREGIGCLAILCSNDFDQEYYLNSAQQSKRNTNVTGGKIMQYIGGGGRGILCDSEEMAVLNQRSTFEFQHVWERCLVEVADGVIDVIPLESGFARDVHGRLIFTERLGSLGWRDKGQGGNDARTNNIEHSMRAIGTSQSSNSFSTTTVNFCCHDDGVRAIRLRV